MGIIGTVLIAIFSFGALIFVHELGHYLFARLFKVTVNEFSIGMGPRLFSHTSKKTGIKYSIACLPIGGYVAMAGEERAEEGKESAPVEDDPNSFDKKPAWQRLIITLAGAFVNILVGFVAMIVVVACMRRGTTKVGAFYTEEELVGTSITVTSDKWLRVDDEIIAVNGKRVGIYEALRYEVMRAGNEPVDLTVIRDGKETELSDVVFPVLEEEGETFGTVDFRVYAKEKTFFNVIGDGWSNLWLNVRMVWESIFDLIRGRYSLGAVSGPVGISSALGEAASAGFISFLNLFAMISINLGVMNLLPIPALDGGRIITILIEMITRKKLPPRVENMINTVGLMLLLGLSVVVLFKDIFSLIF
ncbi:MAG: site-2 protease family protein [Clostridia bacterium]|nr:site-2 protease family protein [Clostridia bacterium]